MCCLGRSLFSKSLDERDWVVQVLILFSCPAYETCWCDVYNICGGFSGIRGYI
jgi:hypothetical protein